LNLPSFFIFTRLEVFHLKPGKQVTKVELQGSDLLQGATTKLRERKQETPTMMRSFLIALCATTGSAFTIGNNAGQQQRTSSMLTLNAEKSASMPFMNRPKLVRQRRQEANIVPPACRLRLLQYCFWGIAF
jgi:hypothetical protein